MYKVEDLVAPRECRHRKFYEIPKEYEIHKKSPEETECKDTLMNYIYHNIMCHNASFNGPYGRRSVIYCDYTASGQALHFIEDFLRAEVMPFYGNTHTTTSVSSLQSTLFRHEAKDIIRNAVNASEHDAVIFCGTGCTSAVHKLVHALNLQKENVIVFVGPFEHHSNLLPWREINAKIIRIPESNRGLIDLQYLEQELNHYSGKNNTLIGSFNAASNVTGILTDDIAVTALLHKYGALAIWDYAAAGPYVNIDMNPVCTGPAQEYIYKDAIFLSPHKFVGGPDTPGVLIAKKKLFKNHVPSESGGGTVFFVTQNNHRYLKEVEMREEGGTPSIIGAIRAGMVFQLKQSIGTQFITNKDKDLCLQAIGCWSNISSLKILGSTEVDRLPIFSFVIQHPMSGLYLHHNFVCALLNDLFGIQSRGGCACSGPYALDLLGINEGLAAQFETLLAENNALDRVHLRRQKESSDREVLRPGFCRLNIPYFMDDDDVNFVIKAVSIVAEQGWKLLPQYVFNPETGEWKHREHQVFGDRKWLGSISYKNGHFSYSKGSVNECSPKTRSECIDEALDIFKKAMQVSSRVQLPDQKNIFDDEASKFRWFLLPSEAQQYLNSQNVSCDARLPFFVRESYCGPERYFPPDSIFHPDSSGTLFDAPDNNNVTSASTLCCSINEEPADIDGTASFKGCQNFTQCEMHCDIKANMCRKIPLTKTFSVWHSPPRKIFNAFLKAVKEFKMIKDKDRVLVCLSGGKDSLSLLHTLHQYQFYAHNENVHFDLGAVTVDPKSSSYDPSPLKGYLASLGVPYFFEEQAILEQASLVEKCKSICSFCSRLKRGRIYFCAHREGYNVVALGQHLDDLAESFIMSAFHNGRLRTMKASYTDKSESLRVIRPFVFVREKQLRQFAEEKKMPVITENCPACFEAPKERHRIKQLLATQEIQFPKLYSSLMSTMHPLMAINKTGLESKLSDMFNVDDDDDEL